MFDARPLHSTFRKESFKNFMYLVHCQRKKEYLSSIVDPIRNFRQWNNFPDTVRVLPLKSSADFYTECVADSTGTVAIL